MTDIRKEDEIIVKKGRYSSHIKIDLGDYRAFISFTLISITVFFAYTGNEAWREFALMTGMAVSYWFGQRNSRKRMSQKRDTNQGEER